MELIENKSTASVSIKKVNGTQWVDANDQLAVEEPIEIKLNYFDGGHATEKNISVTMRTPGHDEELALGFLFTEGIIQRVDQIKEVNTPKENTIVVTLVESEIPSLQSTERNFYTTSSCGVCGKSSIDAIRTTSAYQPSADRMVIHSSFLFGLQDRLRKVQAVFESTGGLHASAIFDVESKLITLREDVGRHNALDKVIGASFMNNKLPLSDVLLLLSGRASFELIQKASMAGIKIVAAIGAPSSLAVKLAQEFDMTLIGFLRDNRFNIYSGQKRIEL